MPGKQGRVTKMQSIRCIAYCLYEPTLLIWCAHCESKLCPARHTPETFLIVTHLHDASSIGCNDPAQHSKSSRRESINPRG